MRTTFHRELWIVVVTFFFAAPTFGQSEPVSQKEQAQPFKYVELGPSRKLAYDSTKLHKVAFSPDNKLLLAFWSLRYYDAPNRAIRDRRELEIWDVERHTLLHKLSAKDSEDFYSVYFSPDSRLLAGISREGRGVGSESDRIFHVVDSHTLELKQSIQVFSDYIKGLSFWPDEQTLTALTRKGVQQWDVRTGRLLRTMPEPQEPNLHIAFSPDKMTFATVSDMDTSAHRHSPSTGVRLYDIKTGNLVRVLEKSFRSLYLTFSPDGTMLAAGDVLWDVKTGQRIQKIELMPGGLDILSYLYCLTFSPDGKLVAGGGGDSNHVGLWDVQTGRLIRTLPEVEAKAIGTERNFPGTVYDVAFSSDGNLLAVGNEDGTLKLWQLK